MLSENKYPTKGDKAINSGEVDSYNMNTEVRAEEITWEIDSGCDGLEPCQEMCFPHTDSKDPTPSCCSRSHKSR